MECKTLPRLGCQTLSHGLGAVKVVGIEYHVDLSGLGIALVWFPKQLQEQQTVLALSLPPGHSHEIMDVSCGILR